MFEVGYKKFKYLDIRQYAVFEIPWKSIGAISELVFANSQPNITLGRKVSIAIGFEWIIMCVVVKAADDVIMAIQWLKPGLLRVRLMLPLIASPRS